MKMKEVMEKTGLSEKTIRFYEGRGLVKPETQWRNGRTYHEFSEQNVETLHAVVKLREARFAIGEILSIQNDPTALPDILTVYQKRIQQEYADIGQLQTFAAALDTSKIHNFQELYQELCRQPVQAETYVPELHFGKYDLETSEQKQLAVAKYAEKKEVHIGRWMIAALCLICVLSVSANIVLLKSKTEQIPTASEATEGWVYYLADNTLMRCLPDGSSAEAIYQQSDPHNDFDFIVGDMRIYFIDGTALYSVNADGTGKHHYPGSFAASGSSHYSSSWPALALDDGLLYACYSKSGQFGASTHDIVQISTETGEMNSIQQAYADTYFGVYQGRLYIYNVDAAEIDMQILDLQTKTIVDAAEIERTAEPVWFSEGIAYFSVADSGGPSLLKFSEDDFNGTEIDHCNGWYWGGYRNYFIYSNSTAYVTSIGSDDKKKVVLRDHTTLTEYGVVSSDAATVEITPYP